MVDFGVQYIKFFIIAVAVFTMNYIYLAKLIKCERFSRVVFCSISITIYTILILYVTVLSREVGHSAFTTDIFRCIKSSFLLGINTAKALYSLSQTGVWTGIYYSDFYCAMIKEGIENVMLFLPLGIIMSSFSSEKKRPTSVCLYCIAMSLLIEVLQLFTGRGTFDVDDLINNSMGGLLGWWIINRIRWYNNMSLKSYVKRILNSGGGAKSS